MPSGSFPSVSFLAVSIIDVADENFLHFGSQTVTGRIKDDNTDFKERVRSMMVGSQRLLIILSVKANKVTKEALSFSDVQIEGISVKKSWTGESIKDEKQKVKEKKGRNPLYCISDSATIMLNAQALAPLTHISGCSHAMSNILEKTFKVDEDFIVWQKALGQAKFKGVMKDYAYLLPPKQRTVAQLRNAARTNINESVIWSKDILANFEKLSPEEQIAFQWVKDHQNFVSNRLTLAFELTQKMLVILENTGLGMGIK